MQMPYVWLMIAFTLGSFPGEGLWVHEGCNGGPLKEVGA